MKEAAAARGRRPGAGSGRGRRCRMRAAAARRGSVKAGVMASNFPPEKREKPVVGSTFVFEHKCIQRPNESPLVIHLVHIIIEFEKKSSRTARSSPTGVVAVVPDAEPQATWASCGDSVGLLKWWPQSTLNLGQATCTHASTWASNLLQSVRSDFGEDEAEVGDASLSEE